MKMHGLARLHTAMQAVPIERTRFRIQHNGLIFEGVFLTDAQPYQFGLACLAHNLVLMIEVTRQYEILAHFGDQYGAFSAAFKTGADSNQPLKAGDFFREIDAKLPHTVTAKDRARPTDLAIWRSEVEEADKKFLCGWRDNNAYRTQVSAANLAKTLEWLGQAAHDWCITHNISTRWTHEASQALGTLDPPRSPQCP
jgi:hypothetical protein